MEKKDEKYTPKRMKTTNKQIKNSHNLSNKKEEKKGKKKKTRKIKKIIFTIIFLALLACACYFGYNTYIKAKDKNVINDVQDYMNLKENTQIGEEQINKISELKKQNQDIIGWIAIDDTKINYPLLQNEDNNYYLNHDYRNEVNNYGSIYLKNICDINDNNSNLVIYGHNMNNGEMFNNLLKYKDEEFYKNHDTVKLITENESREYKIIAVFTSRIFYKNEKNVFRYYNEIELDSEEKYNNFVQNAKNIQLYDTGIDANYGEQLLTMITCEYSQDNGRMVVVAKRVK